jgi:dTDP-4-dehydrorhamnose reductase
MVAGGYSFWYELAQAGFALAGMHPEVLPLTSDQFRAKAPRPAYSVLDNRQFRAAGFEDMRHWREALADYVRGREAAGLH